MGPDIVEYLVGAFLESVLGCQFVLYNYRTGADGQENQHEIDVIGLEHSGGENSAYLCEVSAHSRGHLGRNEAEVIQRLHQKFSWHHQFAEELLPEYKCQSMLWAPRVTGNAVRGALDELEHGGVAVVTNDDFYAALSFLYWEAERATRKSENPAFRLMQVLAHGRL